MFDVKKETERLMQQFVARLEAMGALFRAKANAMAWKFAAEKLESDLGAMAEGSLSWQGKSTTRLTVPVAMTTAPRQAVLARARTAKVVICGPKPKERAERYRDLLDAQTGFWSRRDGKVKYECFGSRLPSSNQGNAVFYRMKRTDNGEEKDVKFASIVSDWKHLDA